MYFHKNKQSGTTLVETLVASAIFIIFSLAIYQLYSKMIEVSGRIRTKTVATQIASEQIEFVRNLQYSDIGLISGIPVGLVAQNKTVVKNGTTFNVKTTIRNIDFPADGTLGGSPNDLSPADNKLMIVEVTCTSCKSPVVVEYTTTIAPKSLETENGNGALVIKVIDANGLPVPDASVNIENNYTSPTINYTDVTDSFGVLTIVDAPPSTEKYHITVSKTGYSTEQTYIPGGSGNPNPTKPHITVAANTVSQSTFSIDQSSTIVLEEQSGECASITGVSGSFVGSKLIGTTPDVIKTTIPFTASSVLNTINNIEWDTYSVSIGGSSYDIVGTNPIFPISISPGSNQKVTLTLKPPASKRLVVAVTDLAGLPIAGATVEVVGPSGTFTGQTSVGSITQTDWSGGDGHANFTDKTKFDSSDGGIDYSGTGGQLKLAPDVTNYVASGTLTSSTIDFGDPTIFQQLTWFPTSQPSGIGATPVSFQIATNNDNATWNFVGPDGTNATFYTNPTSDISDDHDNHQYLRYKLFFSTSDITKTPTISDISFTYTSGCMPPGQIDFGGLNSGSYTITVTKAGYATTAKNITINSNVYQAIQINP